MNTDAKAEISMNGYAKNLSARKFFDENGNLDVNGDGNINIAFIGGSLTQGRNAWTDPVANWFRERFPNKTVKYHNAGIGATNSEVAAVRLRKDVFDHMIPDVIFVDFAVNDGGFSICEDAALVKNGAYMESIVKQCAALENKPIVIFLYYPLGQRKGTNTYNDWYNGVRLKSKLGEAYGISGVDVWEYFEKLYIEQTKFDPSLTYDTFLLRYYDGQDMTHPTNVGFSVFGDAIIEALSASPEKFLANKSNVPTYLTRFEDITNLSYVLTPPEDARFVIEGSFKYYKSANAYAQGDPRAVTSGKVANNQLSHGVLQFEEGVGSIRFETDADIIKLYGMYSSKGMNLDVVCDGEKISEINTNSNNDYLFMKGVDIPQNGNETHVIKITPAAENGDNYVFRIGYVVECYKN